MKNAPTVMGKPVYTKNFTTAGGCAGKTMLNFAKTVIKTKKLKGAWSTVPFYPHLLGKASKFGLFCSYGFVVYNWGQTLWSIFKTKDPSVRAMKRGYNLI